MDFRALPSRDRENNFNLLRILAAGAVLVSHAYPISLGRGAAEPLETVLGMSLGTLAVLTFFAISGYFISQSFHNRGNVIDFVVARSLRIYPGLFVALILTVLILGPVFTHFDLATYATSTKTLLYLPKNFLLWPLQYELPGVFDNNPYPQAINGSLWTLAYEVACYAMVVAVGLFTLAKARWRFAAFLVVYAIIYAAVLPLVRGDLLHFQMLRNIHLLALPFVIGMSLFQFRNQAPLRFLILATLAFSSAISYGTAWFHELFVLTWSYGILYLGFTKFDPLLAYNRLGDYSYGTYIYAFPIEQIVAALFRGSTPITLMALSMPGTILLAVLSWHLVEDRALAQRSSVSAWVRRTIKSAGFNSSEKGASCNHQLDK